MLNFRFICLNWKLWISDSTVSLQILSFTFVTFYILCLIKCSFISFSLSCHGRFRFDRDIPRRVGDGSRRSVFTCILLYSLAQCNYMMASPLSDKATIKYIYILFWSARYSRYAFGSNATGIMSGYDQWYMLWKIRGTATASKINILQ